MSWLAVILCYIIGSFPTAYIAGQRLKGKDIRQMGDGNMGARNAYWELGRSIGILIFIIDAAKGSLSIMLAIALHLPESLVLLCGLAAVAGHNWPLFLHFRGGRGESTTIGILFVLIPKTMALSAGLGLISLLVWKNVLLTSAVIFISQPIISWWLKVPASLLGYGILLPVIVGLTHSLQWRETTFNTRRGNT